MQSLSPAFPFSDGLMNTYPRRVPIFPIPVRRPEALAVRPLAVEQPLSVVTSPAEEAVGVDPGDPWLPFDTLENASPTSSDPIPEVTADAATISAETDRVERIGDADDQGHFPTPPIYFGTVRLHDWKTTARGGMSVDVGVLDTPPTGLHPFKGLYCGKQSGQRLRVWFGQVGDTPGEIDGLHAGEALLMRWSDDSINGMALKILLDDGPDGTRVHPFNGLPIGRSEGEKLQMAAWAIADDEKLVDPRKTKKRVPFYELSEVRQAHILCGEPRFVSYLKRYEPRFTRNTPVDVDILSAPREYATAVLYLYLKIESRKTLGQDNAEGRRAQKLWAALLKEYFDDYYNRR